MLMAGKGKTLIAGDFASIEARVLFWLARDKTALDIFRAVDKDPENNPDIYMVQAGSIYGIDPMKAYKGSEERYLGKKSILGLGYGMGWRKFQSTVFDESGIELDNLFAKRVVDKYRKRWKSVPRLWKRFESAAIKAVMDRVSVRVNNYVKYECNGPFLYCILPSGRKLAYYKPHIIEDLDPWDNETHKLAYYGTNSQSYKWERIHTYGGKLTENAVQAIARDLMAYAMLRLERSGYRIVLTVHDEIVCEVPNTIGSDKIFRDIMSIVPKWARGCPIECESWIGKRYRK
jgi:DNA polymerase